MENEFKAKVEPYIIMLEHPITGERMGICAAMFLNINFLSCLHGSERKVNEKHSFF